MQDGPPWLAGAAFRFHLFHHCLPRYLTGLNGSGLSFHCRPFLPFSGGRPPCFKAPRVPFLPFDVRVSSAKYLIPNTFLETKFKRQNYIIVFHILIIFSILYSILNSIPFLMYILFYILFYSWIGRQRKTHKKLFCRETERATTNPRPLLESPRRGASIGVKTQAPFLFFGKLIL